MPINSDIFKNLKQDIKVFVETGTLSGTGVQAALDAGFDTIHSMEAYRARYIKCNERFSDNSKVNLWLGDSSNDLCDMLEKISERALFWLDAHFDSSGHEKNLVCSFDSCPVISELNQIQLHSIKTHTILIDDRRMFTGKEEVWHNITEEMIHKKLYQINSKYKIDIIDSSHFSNDIIVAEIVI